MHRYSLPLGLLAAVLAGSALGGCSASTDTASASRPETPARAGSADAAVQREADQLRQQVDPFRQLGWVLDWTAPVPGTDGLRFLEESDGVVLIHDDRNVVTVRDANSGAFRWSQQIDEPVVRYVGHATVRNARWRPLGEDARTLDLLVSVSPSSAYVRELSTGELLARQRLRSVATTPPTLDAGTIILGSVTGEVIFHDYLKDVYTNLFGMGAPIAVQPTPVAGGDVVVVDEGGGVAIINERTAEASGRRFQMFDGADHPPATDDRAAYIASRDQSLYAFDAVSGTQRWRLRTQRPLVDPPATHGGRVFQVVPERGLLAINARSGDVEWTADDVQAGGVIAVVSDELLVHNPQDQRLFLIDPRTGGVIERFDIPKVRRIAVDGFVDPDLYVQFDGRRLAKLRIP